MCSGATERQFELAATYLTTCVHFPANLRQHDNFALIGLRRAARRARITKLIDARPLYGLFLCCVWCMHVHTKHTTRII